MSSDELRQRNLKLMEELNPGRIYRIRIPVDKLVQRWAGEIEPRDRKSMKKARQLELLNVFDIDGDLEPEVMGVRYFLAYSLRNIKPHRLRAPTERRAHDDWLYGGEIKYHADGMGYFEDIKDGGFLGRKATNGREYGPIDLYDTDYEPEKVQFYQLVDIEFARELRRVDGDYAIP